MKHFAEKHHFCRLPDIVDVRQFQHKKHRDIHVPVNCMLSTRHTTYVVYVPMSIVQMLWPATFFLFTSAQDAIEAALVEGLEQPASAPPRIHSLSVASSLPPLTLVGKHFDRVVRAADPTSEEWVVFFCVSWLDECQDLRDGFRTINVGARFFGGRPSLAELRKLNVPGLDEQAGGKKKAFGGDASSGRGLRSGASCLDVLEKRSVLVAEETGMTLHREDDKDYRFAFDCVMRPETEQREVYDRTARPLLHKVLEGLGPSKAIESLSALTEAAPSTRGYNGCLFAYGQTGSGKTFTMQGSSEKKGIIPTLCTELFGEIKDCAEKRNITVVCSVLEIYNEKVRDLSVDSSDDLSIREDSAEGGKGIHVEGLTEVQVRSCEEVLDCIAKAQQRRAVGKTNMNEHSSRRLAFRHGSHSVVTLRIGAYDCDDVDGATLTVSKLHLIDLAGSERQKATGATGDRLKEGAQINLSLSALGNVINALTERTSGGRHIPYRDSKLTRMIALPGEDVYSVMICNVSPAKINVDETLSSLRFAERAKKIENKAVVNRDPKGERILELLQENKALRAKIARLEAHVDRAFADYDDDDPVVAAGDGDGGDDDDDHADVGCAVVPVVVMMRVVVVVLVVAWLLSRLDVNEARTEREADLDQAWGLSHLRRQSGILNAKLNGHDAAFLPRVRFAEVDCAEDKVLCNREQAVSGHGGPRAVLLCGG
eukprot:s4067_g10.t1